MNAVPVPVLRPDFKSSLLEGIPPSDLKVIVAEARVRRLFARQVPTHEGDPATHLLLLTSGRARYYTLSPDGQTSLIHWIVPGDTMGLQALLPQPVSYLASTEVVKDGQALVWDRATIRGLAARYPRLFENALVIASNFIRRFISIHQGLTSQTAEERLAQVVLDLSDRIGHTCARGVEFELTNEHLATMASVSVFTASRMMSVWQRRGAIAKSRGKIVLRSPERLLQQ